MLITERASGPIGFQDLGFKSRDVQGYRRGVCRFRDLDVREPGCVGSRFLGFLVGALVQVSGVRVSISS